MPDECAGSWRATEKPDRLVGRMCLLLADNRKISHQEGEADNVAALLSLLFHGLED
jgi:hypothetical protein